MVPLSAFFDILQYSGSRTLDSAGPGLGWGGQVGEHTYPSPWPAKSPSHLGALGPLGILGGKSQTSLKRGANGTFSIIWCFLALLPQRAADRRAEVQERKTPWKRAGHRKCPQGLPAQDTGPPPASCVLTLGPPCLPGRGGLARPGTCQQDKLPAPPASTRTPKAVSDLGRTGVGWRQERLEGFAEQ